MNPILLIVIFFGVLAVLIRAAVVASTRRRGMVAGFLAFGWALLMFGAARWMETANQRMWYGTAARTLLDATTEAIDAGKATEVSRELKMMRKDLRVTYEMRGNFKELATEAAARLKELREAGASGK